MARGHTVHKPGERAPEAGAYYCILCRLRGESSTCEVQKDEMFVECPRCLERGVFEWDMAWKAASQRARRRRAASPWPGSLSEPA